MLSILAKLDLVPQLPSLNRLPPSTGDASFLSVSIVHASSETILTQSSSGSTHMTWKDRKDSENRKVVALGGKPPKNQRLPLSVARVTMKKQKQRDQKLQEERMVLGRFGGMLGNGSKRATEKRRPENKVLKSTEGYFRNGVLNVKNLLKPGATRELDRSINTLSAGFDNPGKKKGGFGKKKGKKKGGGKKRC